MNSNFPWDFQFYPTLINIGFKNTSGKNKELMKKEKETNFKKDKLCLILKKAIIKRPNGQKILKDFFFNHMK